MKGCLSVITSVLEYGAASQLNRLGSADDSLYYEYPRGSSIAAPFKAVSVVLTCIVLLSYCLSVFFARGAQPQGVPPAEHLWNARMSGPLAPASWPEAPYVKE